MIIIGPTVATWHEQELALSAELIHSFVCTVESQATESIQLYLKGRQTTVEEHEYGNETFAEGIEEYRGLRSDTWDLKSLFEEHFPSLQRRSAFLTIWGYFETELDKLCSLYKKEKHFSLDLSDIKGKGIDRSTRYLEEVAGLDVQSSSPEWKEIKTIRELRNKIAHQDGRLVTKKGNAALGLIEYVDRSPFLKKDGEVIVLQEGFLKFVVDRFSAYFSLLGSAIGKKSSLGTSGARTTGS